MTFSSKDFPRIITTSSITVVYKGKPNIVKSDSVHYHKLLSAIRNEHWDDIPLLLNPEAAVSHLSDGALRVEDGQVYLTDEDGNEFTVSSSLNNNILLHIEKELDLQPLVEFAKNLNQNISFRSRHQLFDWIEGTNLTVTEDGCFLAYKSVNEDFTDCRKGELDNSPGKVVKIPRNEVDDDPTRVCSHGLHAGTYEYANNFVGSKLVLVKINPANVVSVPIDYNCSKLRCCEYEVLEEAEKKITEPVWPPLDYYDEFHDEDEYDNL